MLTLIFIYSKPSVFDDKQVILHDGVQAAYGNKEIRDYRADNNEEVIWTNKLFSGMPLYVTGTYFINNFSNKINNALLILPQMADVLFLSFLGVFVLLLCLRINSLLSVILGFAYTFNTYSIVCLEAGHYAKILAIAYTPAILGSMALLFRKKYILGTVLAALSISLALSSKHYQIIFYFGFFGAVYFSFEIIKGILDKEIKHVISVLGLTLVALIIAVGPHISSLWTTFEYQKYSIRGKKELSPVVDSNTTKKAELVTEGLDKDYAFGWSQGKWESFTLLIPHLYGGASGEELNGEQIPGYWGDQPGTAGPVYAGCILFFLFIFYLVNIKKIKNYWVLVAGILMLFFAWGRNMEWFNYFMFDHFPLFNKFRSVSMAMIFVILAMVIGAGLGLDFFMNIQDKEEKKKTFFLSSGVFVGLTLLVYFLTKTNGNLGYYPQQLNLDQTDMLKQYRLELLSNSLAHVLIFSGLAIVSIYLYLQNTFNKTALVVALSAISIFDLWSIDWKYLNWDSYEYVENASELQPDDANLEILKDKSYYRVFDLNDPFNTNNCSYFHNSIGGYDAAKMQRYQDLIERQISKFNMNVINMLNTKYVITQERKVQANNGVFGPAWFVSNIKEVESADQEMAFLGDSSFKPEKIAVIDRSKFKSDLKTLSVGKINFEKYKPNNMKYSSSNLGDGLAVFSEIYYPAGWKAYIDGRESEIFRVNYILRALKIPAGNHKIEFKFEPQSYILGEQISLVFSILLISIVTLGFSFVIYKELTNKKSNVLTKSPPKTNILA